MDPETYANGMYPTLFDMESDASDELKTLINELDRTSDIVASSPIVESNHAQSHSYDREGEFTNTADDAAWDEGWTFKKDGRNHEYEAYMGRVIDGGTFELLQSAHTTDKGFATRAKRMRNMTRSLIEKISDNTLYGGRDALGKQAMGATMYLEDIYTYMDIMKSIDQNKLPFKGDNSCIAFDNQLGLETSDSATITGKKSQNVWTSIYGIAWGLDQIYRIYPASKGQAGIQFEWHFDQPKTYVDKMDGKTKKIWVDELTAEAYYGLCVANRWSLNGLRNIYLDHEKAEDQMLEMANVQKNLINLWRCFSIGKPELKMVFYCNDVLLGQMEEYLSTKVLKIETAPGSNDGSEVNSVNRLRVTNNITLVSDPAVKLTESYIA